MPSLRDIPLDPEKTAIIVESSGPTATVLRRLGNQEWFTDGVSIATSSHASRESTPVRTQDARFFPLAPQAGYDGLRFGSGKEVAFRLPKEPPHYAFTSRRHFRVFLN